MYIVILGAPGAGKGTQADILSKDLGLPHVASGDLFRQAVEEGSQTGLAAKGYMEQGLLVPDELTMEMILDRLGRADCASGCVLDGFPRTVHQAEILDRAMDEKGRHISKAIYIEVPDEELIRRLSGRWLCRTCQVPYHVISSPPEAQGTCDRCGGQLYQRPDDREDTVNERLRIFSAQTAPLLNYYDIQKKLLRVSGTLSVQEVADEIASALKARA